MQTKGVGNRLVEDDTTHLLPPCVIPSVPKLIQQLLEELGREKRRQRFGHARGVVAFPFGVMT